MSYAQTDGCPGLTGALEKCSNTFPLSATMRLIPQAEGHSVSNRKLIIHNNNIIPYFHVIVKYFRLQKTQFGIAAF